MEREKEEGEVDFMNQSPNGREEIDVNNDSSISSLFGILILPSKCSSSVTAVLCCSLRRAISVVPRIGAP